MTKEGRRGGEGGAGPDAGEGGGEAEGTQAVAEVEQVKFSCAIDCSSIQEIFPPDYHQS